MVRLSEAQTALSEAKAVAAELRARALRLSPGSPAWRTAEARCAETGARIARLSAVVTRLLAERQTGSTERRRAANAAHEARQAVFERHFFDIAKERLDEEVYREWICETELRLADGSAPAGDVKRDVLADLRRRLAIVGKRSTELQEELDATRKTRDAARSATNESARKLRDAQDRIAMLERELRDAQQAPERPVVLRVVERPVEPPPGTDEAPAVPEAIRRPRPPGACSIAGRFRGRLMKDGTCGRHGVAEARP